MGQVTYTHSDPIGTTRVITDDTGAPTTRPVYTAFGEPVFEDGSVGTRYRYAGAWGYENFAGLDWGTHDWGGSNGIDTLEFPYLHVGHRWYDPATGRFLQRDPLGIEGGLNGYEYVESTPTTSADSSGLFAMDTGTMVIIEHDRKRTPPKPPKPPASSVGGPTGAQACKGAGVFMVMCGTAAVTFGGSAVETAAGGLIFTGTGLWGYGESCDFFTWAIYQAL